VNRGFAFSALLHASMFVVVMISPPSRGPRWQVPDAIAVELVASQPSRPTPVAPPVVEAPVVEPVTEPVVEPVKEAPKEAAPPKPKVDKPVKPPEARQIRKDAPRRRDEPTLEERIKRRLTDTEQAAADQPAAPATQPAPPAASPGVSSTEVHASDFPYAWYLNTLRTRITDAWDPPGESLLTGRGNKVLVSLRVHRDGSVSNVRVEGASGTPGLDASARRAVERAQPFPPLPEGYEGSSLDVAVRFTAGGSR
jgi:TonB family protein